MPFSRLCGGSPGRRNGAGPRGVQSQVFKQMDVDATFISRSGGNGNGDMDGKGRKPNRPGRGGTMKCSLCRRLKQAVR